MNEKLFGDNIVRFRKDAGLTQGELADKLHISTQAVSKWENGHSLPETALLPSLAKILCTSIDELFCASSLTILEALYGDGIEQINVTKRLNRLVDNDTLDIAVSAGLLGAGVIENRPVYLTVKYQTPQGICYSALLEGETSQFTARDEPEKLPESGLQIIAGCYGTKAHHYDLMQKIEHYRPFNWDAFHANHEIFPSDPANDNTEHLTLVYLNSGGIHVATCAEGESLAYRNNRTELTRQFAGREYFLKDVPKIPPFGEGMECSWAAALTAALKAMRVDTTYEEVMGVSGACYRLAFCSPGWDYSSVDGLVAYDYATPGFAAFGFTPKQYCRIEKPDRAEHRSRIVKELRNNMPVLGINLRVAPEWGVIAGYAKDGEDLFCRTKYDKPTIENDPDFMRGRPPFVPNPEIPDDYLYVDNWPFLLCYFDGKRNAPSSRENLIASLRVFADCAEKTGEGGYFMGFKAFEVWASDLRDDAFYQSCDDERFTRRFSVNQFCTLSLCDARKAAYAYLNSHTSEFSDSSIDEIAVLFGKVADIAREIHIMLDSGEELFGDKARAFWTGEKRHKQADLLDEMARLEREAYNKAKVFLSANI